MAARMPKIKANITELIDAAVSLQPQPTAIDGKSRLELTPNSKAKAATPTKPRPVTANGIMEVVVKANMEAYGPEQKVEVTYGDLQSLLKEAQTNGKALKVGLAVLSALGRAVPVLLAPPLHSLVISQTHPTMQPACIGLPYGKVNQSTLQSCGAELRRMVA